MEKLKKLSSTWFCFLLVLSFSNSGLSGQVSTQSSTACPGVTITFHVIATMLGQPNCANINTTSLMPGFWSGLGCGGLIQYDFAGPVMSVDLEMYSINTHDFATFTVNNSGSVFLTNGQCVTLNGNVAGPYTGAGLAGTVSLTVSSNQPFTRLRMDNTGCLSGWFTVCPAAVVLEAKLSHFDVATKENGVVDLNWQTENEVQNDYFQIERSQDGKQWASLGKVEGNGTIETPMQYSFSDPEALNGLNLYRLRQVDFDGASTLSEVKTAVVEGDVRVFPTLTRDYVNVSGIDDRRQVRIFDALGNLLSPPTSEASGITRFDLSGFPAGMYLVRVEVEGVARTRRVILE